MVAEYKYYQQLIVLVLMDAKWLSSALPVLPLSSLLQPLLMQIQRIHIDYFFRLLRLLR